MSDYISSCLCSSKIRKYWKCLLGEKDFRKNWRISLLLNVCLCFFSRRRPQKLDGNNELLLNNTVKYRKKLQSAIIQINRTKKTAQQNLDNPDSSIHGKQKLKHRFKYPWYLVARLINDIGQLSGCKSLQVYWYLWSSTKVDEIISRKSLVYSIH